MSPRCWTGAWRGCAALAAAGALGSAAAQPLPMPNLAPALLGARPPAAAAGEQRPCVALPGAGVRRVVQDGVTLQWRPRPQPLPLNQIFELDLVLCAPAAVLRGVDADMPAHRHGMNYRTTISGGETGVYRVQGLLFHMPGRWRLSFDVEQDSRRLRLTDSLDLP